MGTTKHPDLDRIIQAESDRLLEQWGRVGREDQTRNKGYTLVFGLADDCQMGMTEIRNDGRVVRLASTSDE